MSYEFALILNREITGEEFSALREAGCPGSAMTTISLPPDDSIVTQVDIDTEAANLAEAIQAALDAVKAVPDLKVDTLDVPPQPSGLPDEDESAGENGHSPAALTAGSASDGAEPAPDADTVGNATVVVDAAVVDAAADAAPAAKGKAPAKGRATGKAKAKAPANGTARARAKAGANEADATERKET